MANSASDDYSGDEISGEEHKPTYICLKKAVDEDIICDSSKSSCSVLRTTTGNILNRIIVDPSCRRPPCLAKWPASPMNSVTDLHENIHQHKAALQPTTLAKMCSLRVTSEPYEFRQPAIVGTIGPASSNVNALVELLEAGVNIFRINMSHVDPCFKLEHFRNAIEASNQYKTMKDFLIPTAIMMNLRGPEIRTGQIDSSHKHKKKTLYLKEGDHVRLTVDKMFEKHTTEKMIYVDYQCLPTHASPGMIVYISNEEITLQVDTLEKTSVLCTVQKGGYLKNNQKVYIPQMAKVMPPVTDFDNECLELAINMEVDIISVPNTRNERIIMEIRHKLGKLKENNNIKLLATISSYEGLENIDCILNFADGIIINKNDLPMDIAAEKVFIAQKEIIAKCNRVGKPVLCTARMSFIESSDKISQRIELSDIGGAIFDGADGIILISETALGDQGVQAVTQLSNIIREAEAATMQQPFYFDLADEQIPSIEPARAIALAAVQVANKIQAAAILAVTTSGKTAEMLSWFRPRRPVIAITRVGSVARQLTLWRAIIPLHFSAPLLPDWFHDVKARFEYGIAYGKNCGIIEAGDLLVLVSGFRKNAGFTNSIRIVFAATTKDTFLDSVSQYYNKSMTSN